MGYSIRNERADDYRCVEELTRKAFWNVHAPGCDEHYLIHVMRSHADFIADLDLVLLVDDRIVGNIMYAKSKLVDEEGGEQEILTFGPVSILPEFQRKGYGKRLIEYSMERAAKKGYGAIVIFGNPANYVGLGFKSSRKFNVAYDKGVFPTALLVRELREGAIDSEVNWLYRESAVYNLDRDDADKFDLGFEPMEKQVTPSQEEFFILSNSRVVVESD